MASGLASIFTNNGCGQLRLGVVALRRTKDGVDVETRATLAA